MIKKNVSFSPPFARTHKFIYNDIQIRANTYAKMYTPKHMHAHTQAHIPLRCEKQKSNVPVCAYLITMWFTFVSYMSIHISYISYLSSDFFFVREENNSLSSVAFKLYLRKSQLTGREKYSFTHMQTRNNYMSWLDLEVLLFEVNLLAI